VSRAQSVAQGQQVRPSVRSRGGHGLSGLLCHLSIWQAYTPPPRSGEGHFGLDLRPFYTPSCLRMTVVTRSKRSSRLCAGRSDSRVYPPCQGVSGGAWRCRTSSCQQPLAWNTRSSSVPSKLSERAGLCSKPVELSAKPPAQLARFPGDGLRCSQRIALMPPGLTTRCWTSISDGVVREVAFFHKRSRTARDRLCAFRARRPASDRPTCRILIVSRRERSRSSRTTRQAAARDGSASRCCLYLRPSALEMIELGQAFRDALKAPDRSGKRISVCFRSDGKITGSSHLMPYEGWTFVCGTNSADVHS